MKPRDEEPGHSVSELFTDMDVKLAFGMTFFVG